MVDRFVHHQILEQARDCLEKSKEKLLSGEYFFNFSENIEKLLLDVRTIPLTCTNLVLLFQKVTLKRFFYRYRRKSEQRTPSCTWHRW